MLLAANALIQVVPGLMVWTLISFGLTLFVLKRYAFGPIQRVIDERRSRIRDAVDAADRVREEARELRALTLAEREEAKRDRERILDDTRRQAQAQLEQARADAKADLERRLEENQRELDRENRKLREEIRRDVVELTLLAAEKVTGKVLDSKDQRRLIDETLSEIDVQQLASEN